MRSFIDLIKGNKTTMDELINNNLAKAKLSDFLSSENAKQMSGWILIYIIPKGGRKEAYFEHAGIETYNAIGMLDQTHHRIQHEGLPNHD